MSAVNSYVFQVCVHSQRRLMQSYCCRPEISLITVAKLKGSSKVVHSVYAPKRLLSPTLPTELYQNTLRKEPRGAED